MTYRIDRTAIYGGELRDEPSRPDVQPERDVEARFVGPTLTVVAIVLVLMMLAGIVKV